MSRLANIFTTKSQPTSKLSPTQQWSVAPDHHRFQSHSASSSFTPSPPKRSDTMHSRYVQMLLDQDNIPKAHNILASFFVWLLLASFLVFPGTFTTIQKSIKHQDEAGSFPSKAAETIFRSVKNVPLLVIAAVMCAISAIGMASLSLRHMTNYVWLLNKLFLPGVANCLAGLISTLIGVYTQQKGVWSVIAKVTAIVEGSGLGICGAVYFFLDHYCLDKVKVSHGAHYDAWPKRRSMDLELSQKM
jgi:hypothetical protein